MKQLTIIVLLLFSSSAIACMVYRNIGEVDDPAATMNKVEFTFHGRLVASMPMSMSDKEHAELTERFDLGTADKLRIAREQDVLLTFEVDRVWKGQVGTPFVAQLRHSQPCTSIPPMSVGDKYIIFGRRHVDFDVISRFVSGDSIQAARQVLDRGHK